LSRCSRKIFDDGQITARQFAQHAYATRRRVLQSAGKLPQANLEKAKQLRDRSAGAALYGAGLALYSAGKVTAR